MDKHQAPPDMPHLRTLTYLLEKEVANGYKENFLVTELGMTTSDGKKIYSPEQVDIVNFYRFEGMSDADDNSILYIIETDDKTKGTLVDAYGANSDTTKTEFILEIEKIKKKNADTETN